MAKEGAARRPRANGTGSGGTPSYRLLASDFDETMADYGRVSGETMQALGRLKGSGRLLVLVTGRELEDLEQVFPGLNICDRIVAENGPVIYCPETREQKLLAPAPPEAFIEALRERGVTPLDIGQVVVATREPWAATVLEVIREQGLELQLIFNKGGVMVLPPGVNKGVGLSAVLDELGVTRDEVVAVGDAENDHSLLAMAGYPVAVANAIDGLKERAAMVMPGSAGEGVRQLIEMIVEESLLFQPDLRTAIEKSAPVPAFTSEGAVIDERTR